MDDALDILTWNLNFRSSESLARLEALKPRPGIVTLQEVTVSHEPDVVRALRDMGYSTVSSCDRATDKKRYGNVIAVLGSRPAVVGPHRDLRWPQLLLQAQANTSLGSVSVVTVHAPNGSGNGWAKIETLKVLRRVVENRSRAPLIVTGDFNEPRFARQEGKVVTFGQEKIDGRWEVEPGEWTDRAGETHEWGDWDRAVRWFFEPSEGSGLHNAYRDEHGQEAMDASHICRGASRWFDHIFATSDVAVRSCDFFHEWRDDGLSDHSPLRAKVVRAPD